MPAFCRCRLIKRECTGVRFLMGDRMGPAGSHWSPHDQAAALVTANPRCEVPAAFMWCHQDAGAMLTAKKGP